MTTRLRGDSPRRAAARRFGVELGRAMKRHRATVCGLARDAAVSPTSVHFYLAGQNLPSLETAGRLAELLGAPSLIAIAAEGRSGTCELCSRPFTSAMTAGNRRYCSEDCRVLAGRRRAGSSVRDRAIAAERIAARHADAVAAFCAACEPERACRTPECPLRVVSPFPVARRRVS